MPLARIEEVFVAFLKSLPAPSTLLQVFRSYPRTARPLLEYQRALLRGPSPLSEAERELLAAYVCGLNACAYCQSIHSVVATGLGIEDGLLESLLQDVETAPVEERLKPILRYVRKLTLTPSRMSAADAEAVYSLGWDDQALHDAVSVCALFNFVCRLVDGLGIQEPDGYCREAGERLERIGYAGLLQLLDPDEQKEPDEE